MSEIDMPWRPFLVLVVSDSEGETRSLETVLATSGYAVLKAHSGHHALELACTAQPDAIILGLHTPGIEGTELCRQLRGDARFAATTPIIITALERDSRAKRLEAFSAGAWEFCTHPLDDPTLLFKLQTFMRAKRMSERWRDGNLLDSATNLYNTQGLMNRALDIGADACRRRESLACVALTPCASADEARAGDEITARLVAHAAKACRHCTRRSDVLGRLNETELALIAPSTDARGAIAIVGRLRAFLENEPFNPAGVLRAIELRAGYCAALNLAGGWMDVMDMLLRAASAMRDQPSGRLGAELGYQSGNRIEVARIP